MSAILFVSVLIFINSQVFSQTAAGQFKEFKEQYGRFSIQVLKDWTTQYIHIKQNSVGVSFDPKYANVTLIVEAFDRNTTISEADYEQAIKENNADTVAQLPGAKLIQATDCAKYVIDGNKVCSMIYTTTILYHGKYYTDEEMDIDFQTGNQVVSIAFTGDADIFHKYVPVVEQMINSMKVS
jgi:hypothetical protein